MKFHRKKIIDLIRREKVITSSDAARALKVSWNTAESYLKDLVIDRKVVRIKKRGVTLWLTK